MASARDLLNAYKYHTGAIHFLQLGKFQLALLGECNAIYGIQELLSNHKDHFIFAHMYRILSTSYWEMGNMEPAVRQGQRVLNIMIKNTPMDSTEISLECFRMAFICLQGRLWREAEQFLMKKTIETATLSDALQGGYIQKMEEFLELARLAVREVTPNDGENSDELLRRAIAETIAHNVASGTLQFDEAEFERLPDKKTES